MPEADTAAVEKVLIENEQKINEAVAKGDLAAFKAGVADDAWMFAHTVCTKRGDKWIAVFHQETPKVAMPAPAPEPAKKK